MSNLDLAITLRLRNQLKGGIGEARSDLRGLKDEATKLGATKGADRLATDLKRVEGAATEARRDIAGMRAEAQRLSSSSGARQLAQDLRGAGAAAEQSARQIERMRRAGANVRAGRPLSEGAAGAGAGPGAPAGGGLVAAGKGALGVIGGGLAVRGAVRRTIGEAITFEKAMAEVKKKVEAPSPEAFEKLERTIKRVGVDLGIPQDQMAQLTAEAGASGIAFGDLERFIRLSAKAAIGWDITPQEAAQKLAEIKAATGMSIAEMEVLGDKINALGDNSAAKEKNIIEMFHRAGAAAKEAGVDFNTTLAMLTAVNSAGLQPEIAARWFTSFAGGLRTLDKDSDSKVAALKKLGLTVEQVKKGMKRDAAGTMLDIFDRLGKSADAAEVAIALFGKEWWDETLRAKGAGAELLKQLDLLKKSSNYKGSLDKGLGIQLGTTANHLERLKSLASDVGDRLGRWALPGINSAIQGLIRQMDELAQRQRVAEAGGGAKPHALEPLLRDTPFGGARPEGDPVGKAVSWLKEQIGKIYSFALDQAIAPLPTQDPNRERYAPRMQEAKDNDDLAKKRREEAAALDEQAKRAGKADRKLLQEKAAELRREADQRAAEAKALRREAGPRAGADMTDVEVGQAAADAIVRDNRRARELQGALDGTDKPNVRLPGGAIAGRQAVEAELAEIRKRQRERLGQPEAADGSKGAGSTAASEGPGFAESVAENILGALKRAFSFSEEAKPITPGQPDRPGAKPGGPQADAGGPAKQAAEATAEAVKTALGGDLSAEGQKAGQSYATGLASGGAQAQSTASGTASEVKTALGVDATAEGQRVGASYAAGLAAGAAQAEATAAGIAARVKAQLAGAGGGVTPAATGAIRRSLTVPTTPAAGAGQIREASALGPTRPAGVQSAALQGGGGAGGGGGGGVGSGGGGRGGGSVQIGSITVSGAGDPDRVVDRLGARLASAIDGARSGALHDGTNA